MRGKQREGEQLEALSAGLAVARGEDYVPPEVVQDLEPKSVDELVELGKLGDRLKDAVRVRNGWVWIMLRRKVGHGKFKKTIEEYRLRYNEVWQDMCYARAVQRFPGLAGKITGHAIRHVLSLTGPQINKIEEQITGIPAAEAQKISRSWIEKEYQKIQQEKAKPRKERPMPELPSDLDSLIAKAQSALRLIAELKLTPAEHERARRYAEELDGDWLEAAYNLRDPEHKKPKYWQTMPTAESEFGAEDER